MNALDSRTIQNSLVNTAKNQVSYAESVVDDMLYEAGMYAIQYTADSSVRFYQRQILELGDYDAQMKKNDIEERMKNTRCPANRSNPWASTGDRKARSSPPAENCLPMIFTVPWTSADGSS